MSVDLLRTKLPDCTRWCGFSGDGAAQMLEYCREKECGGVVKINASVGLVFVPPPMVDEQLKQLDGDEEEAGDGDSLQAILCASAAPFDVIKRLGEDCAAEPVDGSFVCYGFTYSL